MDFEWTDIGDLVGYMLVILYWLVDHISTVSATLSAIWFACRIVVFLYKIYKDGVR